MVLDLESLAGNEDEEQTKGGIDEDCHGQDHDGTLCKELSHVWLTNAGEVEGRVLAEPNESHDGIERILIRSEKVNTDSERKDELMYFSLYVNEF